MFEFDTFKPGTCCCGHAISEHLDFSDLFLAKRYVFATDFYLKRSQVNFLRRSLYRRSRWKIINSVAISSS
jgi:hypothetical protein